MAKNMAVRLHIKGTTFDGQVGGILFWIFGIDGFDQSAVWLVCNDTITAYVIGEGIPRHSF